MWWRLLGVTVACLVMALSAAHGADTAAETKPTAPVIAGSRAGDYVGQDVTVEGRVAAIHESPLATVLAFAPNFAGFTATILAGDRDKFPGDLATRVRDHLVRVNGTVTAYRGKPEMALRDPSQLTVSPPPAGSIAAHPAPATSPAAPMDEIRRALVRIETRLESLDARLRAVEQAGAEADDAEPAVGR